jgi:sec-independent protein translocase protein TatC
MIRRALRGLWRLLTAPFRWAGRGLLWLLKRSPLREFFEPEPEDTPILETIGRAAEQPGDFLGGLIVHLDALRLHLLRAALALALTTGLAFAFTERILDWLAAPIGGIQSLQAIEVTEPIGVVMRVAVLVGFTLALPYIAFELLRFIAPGISRRARWLGLFAIPFVALFFVGGMAFAYRYMLPAALPVLLNFMGIATLPRPASYITFVTGLMFWIGVFFEFPVLAYVLSAMGILPAHALRQHWRLAFILLTILAAAITPTIDPVNMMIVLLPLWTLYGISILMAGLGGLGRRRRQSAA